MAQRRLEVVITGDAKGAKGAMEDVEGQGNSLGSKLTSALGGVGAAVGAAAAAGVAGVGVALKGAYDAAVAAEKVSRETERVIQTTGGAAHVSADQVSTLAGHLSDLTGISHETVQGAENLLLTFTNVKNEVGEGNDIFTRASGLILDMSTVLGTDASGAAIQLGKALNDPIKGITALSRAGVSFTEQQKDQIKAMVAAGDTLGAQKVVLAELSKEFGGAAAAAATPMERLQNKVHDFQVAVGERLLPAVDMAATWIGDRLPAAFETLSRDVSAATGFLSDHAGVVRLVAGVGFAYLASEVLTAAAAFVTMAGSAVIGAVTAQLGNLVSYLAYARAAFAQVAASQGVMSASTQALTFALTSQVVVFAAVALAMYELIGWYSDGRDAAQRFVQGVETKVDTSSLGGLRDEMSQVRTEMDRVGQYGSSIGERLNIPAVMEAGGKYDDLKGKLEDLANTYQQRDQVFWDAAKAIQAQQDPAKQTSEGLQQLHDQLDKIATAQKIDITAPGSVAKLKDLQAAAANTDPAVQRLSSGMKEMSDAAGSADDKVKGFKQSLDALFGIAGSMWDAETKLGKSMQDLATAHLQGGNAINFSTNAAEASNAVVAENRSRISGAKDSVIAYTQSVYENALANGQGANALNIASGALSTQREHLIAVMVQAGATRAQAEAYINTLGLTPANIGTIVHLDNAAAAQRLASTQGQINQIGQGATANIYANTSQAEANLARLGIHLSDLERQVVSVNVGYDSGMRAHAMGGIDLYRYANGGENHIAQFAPAGAMRLWAEPETGGEAYIPLAPGKRGRSTDVLSQVASMFGYQLVDATRGLRGDMSDTAARSLLKEARSTRPMARVGASHPGAPTGGDRHLHLHIPYGYVGDEETLGRTIVRHLKAADRQGDRMPWDEN
jgi:hypothetical protein